MIVCEKHDNMRGIVPIEAELLAVDVDSTAQRFLLGH